LDIAHWLAQCCDIRADVGHCWWGLAEVGRGHAGIESRVGPLVLTVGVLPATGAAPNGDDVAGAAQADDVAAAAAVVITVAGVD